MLSTVSAVWLANCMNPKALGADAATARSPTITRTAQNTKRTQLPPPLNPPAATRNLPQPALTEGRTPTTDDAFCRTNPNVKMSDCGLRLPASSRHRVSASEFSRPGRLPRPDRPWRPRLANLAGGRPLPHERVAVMNRFCCNRKPLLRLPAAVY